MAECPPVCSCFMSFSGVSSAESVWEKLPPWQQHQEVEVLEDLAEEALESVDLLGLAVLPGAFRIYKYCTCLNSDWSD